MKLKTCAHLANHFCLMNSIPFSVLYNVLSRSYVKQSLKRNEAFKKENESLVLKHTLLFLSSSSHVFKFCFFE